MVAVLISVGNACVGGRYLDVCVQEPTVKTLALAFLLLIGVGVAAEGERFHIEKGYIYFAMGFDFVERSIGRFGRGASTNPCRPGPPPM